MNFIFSSIFQKKYDEYHSTPEKNTIEIKDPLKMDERGLKQFKAKISYMEYQESTKKNKKEKKFSVVDYIDKDELEDTLLKKETEIKSRKDWSKLRIMEKKEKLIEYLETNKEKHGILYLEDGFYNALLEKHRREQYKFIYDSKEGKLLDIIGLYPEDK